MLLYQKQLTFDFIIFGLLDKYMYIYIYNLYASVFIYIHYPFKMFFFIFVYTLAANAFQNNLAGHIGFEKGFEIYRYQSC